MMKTQTPQKQTKNVADVKPKAPAPAAPAPIIVPTAVSPLFRRIDWVTAAVTALLVFIGYWWTLAPDMTLEDSGELAVASMYAGVPHPPGYPVWTIYTWVFTKIVPVSNIAYRVGLSSAFAAALACGLVGLMVSRGSSMIIEGMAELRNIPRNWENAICIASGFVAALLTGFNGFMWSQAVIVEVYTLSVLSLAGVLACLMRWIYAPHQRRYLYLAFFWFGICFNNHQSLLVIALGLEAAIVAVHPRLGRDLFFWNTVVYLGGLVGLKLDYIGVLAQNASLLIIYNLIGVVSFVAWVYLTVKTKKPGIELARDTAMVLTLGYILAIIGHITNYFTYFEYKKGAFFLFNMVGIGVTAWFIYLIMQTWRSGREWLAALGSGLAWMLGAAFYVYMPIASMSNPPLNWGYPRTVFGFFHAFTRGQYEKINPTTNFWTFIKQIWMYLQGAVDEFNIIYLLLALVPLLFFKRMQKRERAWIIGISAFYLCLSLFLLILLNPGLDRQARDLNKVFFTASHVMLAMSIGYGLTLIAGLLATHYEQYRKWLLIGAGAAVALGAINVAIAYARYANPLVHYSALFTLLLPLAIAALLWLNRTVAPLKGLLLAFVLMPIWPIMAHWEDNEQRGHLFGYWFGHDMFTPPFGIYPEMTRDAILYGGTDPGRFNPTYMIFCESFIPGSKKPRDPEFDRRDVVLITQNALADPPYLNYIRAHYNRSAQIDPLFFSEFVRGPQEVQRNLETNLIARMLLPADRFFTNLGDRIEKKRRAGTSYFKESDFVDPAAFLAKLREPDPLSKHVLNSLSPQTRALLDRGAPDKEWRKAVAHDLNTRVLEKGKLYSPELFANVKLSERTQKFIKEDPKSHTLIRLNRILLEEAFPVARSIGGVYPDIEILTPTPDDHARCFNEYMTDVQHRMATKQLRPGEDVKVVEGRVTVSGQTSVMAINALLAKVIFDKNPDREFFIEESFPLEWMYPYLSPYGIIMKINRNPLPELPEDMLNRDHEFWSKYSERAIGNWITYDTSIADICAFAEKVYLRRDYHGFKGDPKFIRDSDGQKAFSKLRSSIAGVYLWRERQLAGELQKAQASGNSIEHQRAAAAYQRMLRQAEFALKQSYAFCPYSPEATFRYLDLLLRTGRIQDALLIARTSLKFDPHNQPLRQAIGDLERYQAAQRGG
jgi:transmembrane protein TMEM260 (protein O-mannosyltransferase)